MAKKDDANIPAESFNEIAAYLTLAAGSAANADAKGSKGGNATDGNSKDASNGQGKDKNSKDDEKNKANDQQARQGAGRPQRGHHLGPGARSVLFGHQDRVAATPSARSFVAG